MQRAIEMSLAEMEPAAPPAAAAATTTTAAAAKPKVHVLDDKDEDEDEDEDDDAVVVGAGSPAGQRQQGYRLVSIIRHTGSTPSSGHYICDVYNPAVDVWKSYNDSLVTEVSPELVFGPTRQRNAYILFYMSESCLPARAPTSST